MNPHQNFFHHYRLMYRPFINKLNVYLAKHQLHSAQWGVMIMLLREGPKTFSEIAGQLSVEKPTVTRSIQRLETLGYIELVPGKDKREKVVHMTELGLKVSEEITVTIDEFQLEALEGITEAEQLEVSRILAKVRENLLK